jgi:flagella basal body P-ring formation protein FlgA
VRRVIHELELLSLAKRFSVPLDSAPDICFEWELAPLDRTVALEAMRAALPLPDLQIEITETSLFPVPRGRIEFSRDGLGHPANPAAATQVMWRGNLVYGDTHRFSIWARVVISAGLPRVIASTTLKRGEPIRASDIRVATVSGFPLRGDLAEREQDVIGKSPLRDLAPDSEIHLTQLMQVPDVGRGDMVDVEVRTGAARLLLTAKAESAGRSGDLIAIRNLSSNRVFQARVSGKGKAILEMEHSHGN